MKSIKLYWHRGSGRNDSSRRNFGDYLSPLIVEAISARPVEYASLKTADLMAIGTILANEHKAKRLGFKRVLHIWGSGCGRPEEQFSDRHHYHAVRGKETQQRLRGNGHHPVLGDPGLLAYLLLAKQSEKKHAIGFVPHYVDQDSEASKFITQNYRDILFINVYDSPIKVIEEISSCHAIISSSLHGLVVADSLNIPNVRMKISTGVIDELKFSDYYSAFNLTHPTTLVLSDLTPITNSAIVADRISAAYERRPVEEININLKNSFPNFL